MAKAPSEMTDEELDAAILNPPEDGLIPPVEVIIPPEEKKPKEAKKPDAVEPESPVEDEPEVVPAPVEDEEEEPPVSARETKRVTQLLAKMKELQTAPAVPAAPVIPDAIDYKTAIDAEPEVLEQLEADRKAVSDAAYKEGIAQTNATANSIMFHTRLEMDAPKMEAKYPQLDKESDKFNQSVANDVNVLYLQLAGYNNDTDTATNPTLRYSDFVESIFGLADDIGNEKVATSTKEVAKQAANTALRPDGSTVKRLNLNKLPEQMTDEELDARIALAIPPNK